MTKEIIDALDKATVRIEGVIYIPGAVAMEDTPVYLDDFVEETVWSEKNAELLSVQLPVLAPLLDEDRRESAPDTDEIAEFLREQEIDGFFVKVATPVRHYIGSGSFRSGWGSYFTFWLYAPDQASIHKVAITWANELHAEQLASHKKARASKRNK